MFFAVTIFAFLSVNAYAADGDILADSCTVLVRATDTEGVAVVASYNNKGRLKKVVTKPVTKENPVLFKELEVGDKVMFWKSLNSMEFLAASFIVTGAIIPFPTNYEKRLVIFDSNFDGGVTSSCYYLNNYWTDGDGSFAAPTREDGTFRGWFTERDGGVEVKNHEDILEDGATLYAHWWGEWTISKAPTETEIGTVVRKLESNESITEEITLPPLSDTSFWTLVTTQEPTTEKRGI